MINKIYKSAAKKISASKYGRISLGGKKLSDTKTKEFIISQLKSGGTSGRTLEESLKEQGLTKSQLSKRKRLIKMLTGADEHKMTKKEERRMAERVKMRIAAARRSSEMMGGSGEARAKSAAEGLKARKIDKAGALKGALEVGGRKVGARDIGAAEAGIGATASVSQKLSGGVSGPAPSAGAAGSAPPIGFNRMG